MLAEKQLDRRRHEDKPTSTVAVAVCNKNISQILQEGYLSVSEAYILDNDTLLTDSRLRRQPPAAVAHVMNFGNTLQSCGCTQNIQYTE